MTEILQLPFMQRALIAALLSGLLSPAIGTYIVQRRLSLLGDGLGHVAIAGVGLAFLTNTAPMPLAIIVCVVGAVAVELLRQMGKATGDVGLAILFYGGLASGVMMAGMGGRGTGALSQFLFGALTSVSRSDLWLVAALGVVVIVPAIGLLPQLFAICADEDFARVLGLPVRWLNLLIVVLAAITVTISMRTVGLLLVSAMMVIPVATAQNLFAGFRATLFGAMVIGMLTSVGGTIGSYYWDTASGASIVVTAIVVFLASWPLASAIHRHQHRVERAAAAALAAQASGPHVVAEGSNHGPECGHQAVMHGDHVDYVHGQHHHAPHGDHFDEH